MLGSVQGKCTALSDWEKGCLCETTGGEKSSFFRLQIQQLHRPRDLGSLAVKVGSDELPESAEVRSAYCWSLVLVQISDA